MNLQKAKTMLIVVIVVAALFVASPALQRLLAVPQTEFYTEFGLLSSNHNLSNFPFNVASNRSQKIYMDIINRLGYCGYYVVEVKFRNETQPSADSFTHTPSSLPSLYNITVFVADKGTWELPVIFSFDYSVNGTQVNFNHIIFNDARLNLSGYSVTWNSTESLFLGYFFFELWIYNSTTNSFQYNERYLSLPLNLIT